MVFYMKNVEFFDWQLNLKRPISWSISENCGDAVARTPDAHSALHLLLMLEGTAIAQYGNSLLEFKPGEVFVTAPWEVHRSLNPHYRKLLFINIDPAVLQEFFFCGYENLEKLFLLPPEARWKCLNCEHDLTEECRKILQIFKTEDSPQKTMQMYHAVLGVFVKLKIAGNIAEMQSSLLQKLRPALQKLSGKVLTLEQAAQSCNLSSSYFAALFKRNFGLSFAAYERMFRLNGAAGAIARGFSLKEAAADWGFCDKSHLARLLKKQRGTFNGKIS